MDYIDKAICERLKEVMKEFSSGQKDLMDKTGIAQSTISAILNGKRQPTTLVDAMVKEFGINREWLMTGNGFKYQNSNNITDNNNSVIIDKSVIVKELTALYERHQALLAEAQNIMKTIIELNKKILFN